MNQQVINKPNIKEEKDIKKKSIINYINVFRGLAILLIVAGHTMQIGTPDSLTNKISVEVFAGGTALFIFVSGFLFQHLSGKFEYKNYLSKKWTNVILPYFYTAIPGICLCLYMPAVYKNSFEGMNYLLQIPILLSIGRVHNTPTWFIPMIALFFLSSFILLYLEKKNILYKLLPVLFIITFFVPRCDVDYNTVLNLSYYEKYIHYLEYVMMGYVHFMSMYVLGMFCSKYKEKIDLFYDKRFFLIVLMIFSAVANILLSIKFDISNGTVSKIFLTVITLGYLKHYDSLIIKHKRINSFFDFVAQYSFGIFFVHWYFFFLYNQAFNLPNVLPIADNGLITSLVIVTLRFLGVTALSIIFLCQLKRLLLFVNCKMNTRIVLGV